ncbi:MAG TPA: Ppx/GppA phosphatase family protein [Acidimicrobiales bacterium]|nr:Ppx/GppA phosphatase family protein [Acidimicrobiales bacterium]
MSVVAAIDCGTNSTRLLVTDGTRTLSRLMRITRLGQGVDRTRMLVPEAIARTVDVLAEFRGVMDQYGVDKVRIAATSAARDAVNRDEFFDAAARVVGTRPELLSGDDEARTSFGGATADLDPMDGPFLVLDIGGGSTELILGTTAPEAFRSLDIGSVRLTEQYLHGDPPAPEELSNAVGDVRDQLEDLRMQLPTLDAGRTLVGLAGTITTVAAVEQGLKDYDRERIHHFVLTKAAAEDVFRTLATEKLADRKFNPGLDPGRADVIVGGCIILVCVMRVFGFKECLVSEADILDGLAASLL